MKNLTLILIAQLFIFQSLFSQSPCANNNQDDCEPEEAYNSFDNAWTPWIQNNSSFEPTQEYNIPIVVHIIYREEGDNISDGQVDSAIKQANDNFYYAIANGKEKIKIHFELAKLDQNGNCTNGIVRHVVQNTDFGLFSLGWKTQFQWNPQRYCNIFVIPESDGPAARATFPFNICPEEDGLAITNTAFGTDGTASNNAYKFLFVHEMGHYLGLYNVWGNLINCNNCSYDCRITGDKICDTAPAMGPTLYNVDCGDFLGCIIPCTVNNDWKYPKKNFMSYAYSCHETFSNEQSKRMYFSLENYRTELWQQQNENCFCCGPSDVDEVITGNQIISGTFEKNHNIVMSSNSSLTLSSTCNLKMCKDKFIEVQNGATLKIYGKLTNGDCGGAWAGIKVKNGGKVYTYYGSTIENAITAIEGENASTIDSRGTVFKNNTTGLKLQNSTSGIYFILESCHFITDGDYNNPLPFSAFIELRNNKKNLSILGCMFDNQSDLRGKGIQAFDSKFSITADHDYDKFGHFTQSMKTKFINLEHGIFANEEKTSTYKVEQAVFDRCKIGIYNNLVNGSKIIYNEFNLHEAQTGIMYEGATVGMIVQENVFSGSGANATGIVVKNTGSTNNNIRKNTFTNLQYGNLVNELNGSEGGALITGVYYTCNKNTNTTYDFAISNSAGTDNIRTSQADFLDGLRLAAGNEFAASSSVTGSDFYNEDGSDIKYYYWTNVQNQNPVNSFQIAKQTERENICPIDQRLENPPIISDPTGPNGPIHNFVTDKEDADSLITILIGPPPVNPSPPVNPTTIPPNVPISDLLLPLQEDLDEQFAFISQAVMQETDFDILPLLSNYNYESDLWAVRQLGSQNNWTAATTRYNGILQKWLMTPVRYRDYQIFGDVLGTLRGYDIFQLPGNVLDRVMDAYDTMEDGNGRSWLSSIMAYYGRPVSPYYTGLNGVEYRENKEKESNQIFKNGLVAIYPNPSTGSFILECPGIASLTIFDISGVKIMEQPLKQGKNDINLSYSLKGIFIAKVEYNNRIFVHKFVVE